MAGRIDNVDLKAVVADAGGFGQDGDAAFAFEVIGIHDTLGNFFVFSKNTALAEESIHKRGLAVIDVRNNSYVSGRGDRHLELLWSHVFKGWLCGMHCHEFTLLRQTRVSE